MKATDNNNIEGNILMLSLNAKDNSLMIVDMYDVI